MGGCVGARKRKWYIRIIETEEEVKQEVMEETVHRNDVYKDNEWNKKISRYKHFLHWSSALYGPLLSWLVCLYPFYPFLHLLWLFLWLFSSLYPDPMLLLSWCMLFFKLWPCIVVIISLDTTISSLLQTALPHWLYLCL